MRGPREISEQGGKALDAVGACRLLRLNREAALRVTVKVQLRELADLRN